MSENDPKNRRQAPRTELLLKVSYTSPHELLADYLTDLGAGGMFIRTDAPFRVGELLAFDLSFPSLQQPIELKGVVRWRREEDENRPDEPAGVGVEFVFPSVDEREALGALLDKLADPDAVMESRSSDKPFKVLLVEDNDFVHDLFRHALKRFHREMENAGPLELIGAADGKEALEKLESEHIDLAIVDHFLPLMSGTEFVQEIRGTEAYRHLPVLMVSGGGEDVRELAMDAGVDIYLHKPVLLKQLLRTLRMLMDASNDGVAG